MDAVLFGVVLINDQTTLQGVQVLDANDGTIEKDANYRAQRQYPSAAWSCSRYRIARPLLLTLHGAQSIACCGPCPGPCGSCQSP